MCISRAKIYFQIQKTNFLHFYDHDSCASASEWSWQLTQAVYLLRSVESDLTLKKCFKSLKASIHKQISGFNLRCITGWSSRHRHIAGPSEKKRGFLYRVPFSRTKTQELEKLIFRNQVRPFERTTLYLFRGNNLK